MPKTKESLTVKLLPALMALTLLAACGKQAGESTASNASAGNQASDAKCEGNPLIKAMPPKAAIDGQPFLYWDCEFNSVRAAYGKEGGRQVDVTLTDTRSPDLDKQPAMAIDLLRRTGDSTRAMTQFSVRTSVETGKAMEAQPVTLQMIGGPDYLPIVETAPSGDPIVIHVSPKGDPSEPTAMAVLKDRYVLNVQAHVKGVTINNVTAPQAQALYDPFLKQMHLDQLP